MEDVKDGIKKLEKANLRFFKNGMRAILYRHKEPECGLDVTKGFTIGFFHESDPLIEIAELKFEVCEYED